MVNMGVVNVRVLDDGGTAKKGDWGRLMGFTSNHSGGVLAIIEKYNGQFVYAFLEDICDISGTYDTDNTENTKEKRIEDGIRW